MSMNWKTLGAEGALPSRRIESFLRVFKQFTHNLPSRQVVSYLLICPPLWSQLASGQVVIAFKTYPSICPWATLWKNSGVSFTILIKLAHHVPEPLIMSSFIICSQCTHPHAHWVLFNVFKRNSQFCSVLQQTLKELMMSGSGTWWASLIKIVKETPEFFHKVAHGQIDG